MDGVEPRDAVLFTQNENHRVVAETTAGVDGDGGRLVNYKNFTIIHQNLQGRANHRWLVAVHGVPHEVIILEREKMKLQVGGHS